MTISFSFDPIFEIFVGDFFLYLWFWNRSFSLLCRIHQGRRQDGDRIRCDGVRWVFREARLYPHQQYHRRIRLGNHLNLNPSSSVLSIWAWKNFLRQETPEIRFFRIILLEASIVYKWNYWISQSGFNRETCRLIQTQHQPVRDEINWAGLAWFLVNTPGLKNYGLANHMHINLYNTHRKSQYTMWDHFITKQKKIVCHRP